VSRRKSLKKAVYRYLLANGVVAAVYIVVVVDVFSLIYDESLMRRD
jgi:hypothetical protein